MIYITTDNTVVSALETAIMVANENKMPFVPADPESAVRRALVAAGVNYFDIGLLTGAMVVRLLKGEKIADIAAEIAPANVCLSIGKLLLLSVIASLMVLSVAQHGSLNKARVFQAGE